MLKRETVKQRRQGLQSVIRSKLSVSPCNDPNEVYFVIGCVEAVSYLRHEPGITNAASRPHKLLRIARSKAQGDSPILLKCCLDYIPSSFEQKPRETFDQAYMRSLFDLDYGL